MASRKLVIVESPAKAKTIAKYLGEGFEVLASVGHIRDLVDPKDVPAEKKKTSVGKFSIDGRRIDSPPARIEDLARATPVFETLPGWKTPLAGARRWEDLPTEAQEYVRFIERRLGVPIRWIGTGAGREAIVTR